MILEALLVILVVCGAGVGLYLLADHYIAKRLGTKSVLNKMFNIIKRSKK